VCAVPVHPADELERAQDCELVASSFKVENTQIVKRKILGHSGQRTIEILRLWKIRRENAGNMRAMVGAGRLIALIVRNPDERGDHTPIEIASVLVANTDIMKRRADIGIRIGGEPLDHLLA